MSYSTTTGFVDEDQNSLEYKIEDEVSVELVVNVRKPFWIFINESPLVSHTEL
jgi:hypothetical protein